jgi:hypothetical protein
MLNIRRLDSSILLSVLFFGAGCGGGGSDSIGDREAHAEACYASSCALSRRECEREAGCADMIDCAVGCDSDSCVRDCAGALSDPARQAASSLAGCLSTCTVSEASESSPTESAEPSHPSQPTPPGG